MIENTQQQNTLTGTTAAIALKLKTQFVDLASERVGGETLSCSDDFFAEMENLLKSGRGIFIDDKYTERGKWMDGWESRRSYGRDNGREFDWCIIRLGIRGVIKGFDIDTNYFRGNAPQTVSVEACVSEVQPDNNTVWHTILDKSLVQAHSQNIFDLSEASGNNVLEKSWTHVRLNIFPDGGVARLRVYGEADVSWDDFLTGELVDLAYIKNGGKALLVSDMFFSDKNNLIMPGRGKDMGDGWETKRRRDPGPDWSIVKLGQSGSVEKVIIDTCHFKGNFPDTFILEGTITTDDDFTQNNACWEIIISKTKLYAHREHLFIQEITKPSNVYTHVKLSIFPDGGVSRMRIFGRGSELTEDLSNYENVIHKKNCKYELAINNLNNVSEIDAVQVFMQCCTSTKWVNFMVSALPIANQTQLINCANKYWAQLSENDYLEAFEGHPKIGDVNSLRAKYANTLVHAKALASEEQSAVNKASNNVLVELEKLNNEYHKKFGFIFIVCATGKSAEEMLLLLKQRLPNNQSTELTNAAEEQRKIFQIRLIKMLERFND